ncbi:hypothetical protein [Ewingella americana]
MKASELISQLEAAIKEDGDLEVFVVDRGYFCDGKKDLIQFPLEIKISDASEYDSVSLKPDYDGGLTPVSGKVIVVAETNNHP